MTGRCTYGAVRYALQTPPLNVHVCHCLGCQQLTGCAFVINIWVEQTAVKLTEGEPSSYEMIGPSGKPHSVHSCKTCGTQLWSRYEDARRDTLFERPRTSKCKLMNNEP
ncbi:MAG: GFA family protein [Proteobacteria bacterium]|nr:GFA family protein [Pseudomonadota bacterium]